MAVLRIRDVTEKTVIGVIHYVMQGILCRGQSSGNMTLRPGRLKLSDQGKDWSSVRNKTNR